MALCIRVFVRLFVAALDQFFVAEITEQFITCQNLCKIIGFYPSLHWHQQEDLLLRILGQNLERRSDRHLLRTLA
mgnify:CR=1 FL=1